MIANIRLQQFRSYLEDSFEFDDGVNIIVGPNASGKTNLLEAVLMVARGSSYRARDVDLVAFGKPWARLDTLAGTSNRTVKIVTDTVVQKTYELDGRAFKRLSLHHSLPTVLFEPNHLALLNGSPERRRDYLDELLSQTIAGYSVTLRSYRRALAQRNRLLKTMHVANDQFFPWNIRLSELAGIMVRARAQLVNSIQEVIGNLYQDLARSNTEVSMCYCAAAEPGQYESQMIRQLEVRLHDDLLRGFTSFGPHREDFEVLFDDHPAQEVASRGELRTLVLALKILELQLLETARDQRPLLLLDDVFSELDGARRQALTAHLQPYQTFITTTDADATVRQFPQQRCNVIAIAKANLSG
jgi:DNA replication and repair protein RecF